MISSFKLKFSTELAAHAVQVHGPAELTGAMRALGFAVPSPTLVLAGGASGLSNDDMDLLRPLFTQVLVPLAQDLGAYVVDGGTDAGVMQLMGKACAKVNAAVPLIGVAAIDTVILPATQPSVSDAAPLEPHHTHFILVPGSKWGDESPWLTRVANKLTQGAPSVMLLVNGGETSWDDVSYSVRAGRPVITIAGSGRTADVLTAAIRGDTANERAVRLSTSGLLHFVELPLAADMLPHIMQELFYRK